METFVVKYILCTEDKGNVYFLVDIESVKESTEQKIAAESRFMWVDKLSCLAKYDVIKLYREREGKIRRTPDPPDPDNRYS
jgi:hypothetical protein